MKYTYLIFSSLVLFSSCSQEKKAKQEPQVDPKVLISCDGIGEVKLSDSHEALVSKFGKAVSEHENNRMGSFTTIWENDPKQVNIYWEEKKPPFTKIKYLEAVYMDSPYMTKDSLRIGLSLRDLVKVNGGMPVAFKNFSQENDGGLITTFYAGNIEKQNPCIKGRLEQAKVTLIHKKELAAFQQKEIVESSDDILNRMDVELSSIRVSAK